MRILAFYFQFKIRQKKIFNKFSVSRTSKSPTEGQDPPSLSGYGSRLFGEVDENQVPFYSAEQIQIKLQIKKNFNNYFRIPMVHASKMFVFK